MSGTTAAVRASHAVRRVLEDSACETMVSARSVFAFRRNNCAAFAHGLARAWVVDACAHVAFTATFRAHVGASACDTRAFAHAHAHAHKRARRDGDVCADANTDTGDAQRAQVNAARRAARARRREARAPPVRAKLVVKHDTHIERAEYDIGDALPALMRTLFDERFLQVARSTAGGRAVPPFLYEAFVSLGGNGYMQFERFINAPNEPTPTGTPTMGAASPLAPTAATALMPAEDGLQCVHASPATAATAHDRERFYRLALGPDYCFDDAPDDDDAAPARGTVVSVRAPRAPSEAAHLTGARVSSEAAHHACVAYMYMKVRLFPLVGRTRRRLPCSFSLFRFVCSVMRNGENIEVPLASDTRFEAFVRHHHRIMHTIVEVGREMRARFFPHEARWGAPADADADAVVDAAHGIDAARASCVVVAPRDDAPQGAPPAMHLHTDFMRIAAWPVRAHKIVASLSRDGGCASARAAWTTCGVDVLSIGELRRRLVAEYLRPIDAALLGEFERSVAPAPCFAMWFPRDVAYADVYNTLAVVRAVEPCLRRAQIQLMHVDNGTMLVTDVATLHAVRVVATAYVGFGRKRFVTSAPVHPHLVLAWTTHRFAETFDMQTPLHAVQQRAVVAALADRFMGNALHTWARVLHVGDSCFSAYELLPRLVALWPDAEAQTVQIVAWHRAAERARAERVEKRARAPRRGAHAFRATNMITGILGLVFLRDKHYVQFDTLFALRRLFCNIRDPEQRNVRRSVRDHNDLSAKLCEQFPMLRDFMRSWCARASESRADRLARLPFVLTSRQSLMGVCARTDDGRAVAARDRVPAVLVDFYALCASTHLHADESRAFLLGMSTLDGRTSFGVHRGAMRTGAYVQQTLARRLGDYGHGADLRHDFPDVDAGDPYHRLLEYVVDRRFAGDPARGVAPSVRVQPLATLLRLAEWTQFVDVLNTPHSDLLSVWTADPFAYVFAKHAQSLTLATELRARASAASDASACIVEFEHRFETSFVVRSNIARTKRLELANTGGGGGGGLSDVSGTRLVDLALMYGPFFETDGPRGAACTSRYRNLETMIERVACDEAQREHARLEGTRARLSVASDRLRTGGGGAWADVSGEMDMLRKEWGDTHIGEEIPDFLQSPLAGGAIDRLVQCEASVDTGEAEAEHARRRHAGMKAYWEAQKLDYERMTAADEQRARAQRTAERAVERAAALTRSNAAARSMQPWRAAAPCRAVAAPMQSGSRTLVGYDDL